MPIVSHKGTANQSFELNKGEKFSCIALQNVSTANLLLSPLELTDGLWVSTTAPFNIDSTWREWIGKIRSDEIGRANLFLCAIQSSSKPAILDDENQKLTKLVKFLFHGILLQGIPHFDRGWTFTGANVSSGLEIRSMGELDTYYFSPQPPGRAHANFIPISEKTCHLAKKFVDEFTLIENDSEFSRLKRGMRAIVRGMKEKFVEDRLHEYVRALEALIKPPIGKSTVKFVSRGQTFTLSGNPNENILKECYEIRSKVEHMHEFNKSLATYLPSKQEEILFCEFNS